MAQAVPNPPPGFDKLSVDEKIEYVESLWDAIVDGPEQVAVPDWHPEILRERLEAQAANPTEGRAWSEVRAARQKPLFCVAWSLTVARVFVRPSGEVDIDEGVSMVR